jgi:hypothetical protein
MATIWDLMPASLWPVQPFTAPVDPARASAWTQAAPPSWDPTDDNAASLDWPVAPAASAEAPPYGSAASWGNSAGAWLMPPNDAPRSPDVGSAAYYDPMLADAKRAHDFVRWVFGPPTAPQTGAGGNACTADSTNQLGGASGTSASRQRPPPTFWDLLPPPRQGAPFLPVGLPTDQYLSPISAAWPATPGARASFPGVDQSASDSGVLARISHTIFA